MALSHIYKPLDTDTSAFSSYKFDISENFMIYTMKFLNIAVKEKGSENTQLKEVRDIFEAQVQDSLYHWAWEGVKATAKGGDMLSIALTVQYQKNYPMKQLADKT